MGKKINIMIMKVKSSKGVCSYGYKTGDKVALIIQDPEGYKEGTYNIDESWLPKGTGGGSLIKNSELEHTDLVFKGDICPAVFGDIYRHAFCMLLDGHVPWVYRFDSEGRKTEVPCSDHNNQVIFELEIIERSDISDKDYEERQRKIAEKTIGSYNGD